MNKLLKGSLCFILSLSMVAGCGATTSSEETKQPPATPGVIIEDKKDNLTEVLLGLLPHGAEIIFAATEVHDSPILLGDFNGDGIDEAIVVYRLADQSNSLNIAIFAEEHGEWHKLWTEVGQGYAVNNIELTDLDEDGILELLVGWTIGASAGSGLDIYGWVEGQVTLLDQTGYNQIEIQDIASGERGKAIAIWTKDTGSALAVDVYRFVDQQLTIAPELYSQYFPKVVVYYEEQIKEQPDAWILWYYLADAQLKAGLSSKALQSIDKAKKLEPDLFLVDRLQELEETAKEAEARK